jgi:hypothetical protein
LARNVDTCLGQAPHVQGVILSGGTHYAGSSAIGQTAWDTSGSTLGVSARSASRERLANGPAALRRILPGRRQRLSFIIPTRHDRIVLPPGIGLEPGLWYHNEPAWLDGALRRLGQLPIRAVLDDRQP